MKRIFILGSGKIGVALAHILSQCKDYQISLIDIKLKAARHHFGDSLPSNVEFVECDINDQQAITALLQQQQPLALISALPYFFNAKVAQLAKQYNLAYFDLTEDLATVELIRDYAIDAKNAYVPQCGVAPGLINIIAGDLIQYFDEALEVKLRCGALPEHSSNALGYALTWSVDGLINEYGNSCQALINHKIKEVSPLADLEEIQVDGANYEAFNTSGGAGSLVETYQKKVKKLNYKSIRYPGHCEKMHFLMNGLNLNEHRDWLKQILVTALPATKQDVVMVYISVNGYIDGELTKKNYIKKFYPCEIDGITYSAIQTVTATAAACVIDIVLSNPGHYQGRITQESFALKLILDNRFADYLREK